MCRRGSLTGRECWDTTWGPRARHKLQNNLFPVTHSWGLASTPYPPSPWWWLSSRNESLREFREQVGGRTGPGGRLG